MGSPQRSCSDARAVQRTAASRAAALLYSAEQKHITEQCRVIYNNGMCFCHDVHRQNTEEKIVACLCRNTYVLCFG